ncbi:MAG TPA: DUF4258 domain-containing protein [Dehalococcoidia bacterium]|nr:DUF4258 domain-containing protein [Dehalococcoidia bacterium]
MLSGRSELRRTGACYTVNVTYLPHARRRMRSRRVNEADVEEVLASFHTSYPAEPLPNDPFGATVFVGTIAGRELKVYVQNESNPPLVRTVAWRDER